MASPTKIRALRSIRRALAALPLLLVACGDPPPPVVPPAVSPAPPADLGRAAALEAEARALFASGKLDDAERAAVAAGKIHHRLHGPRHPDTGRVAELFATIKLRQGDRQEAEEALLVTLGAREAEAGPTTPQVAEVLERLGEVAPPERAVPYLQRTLALHRATLGPDHPAVSRALKKLGSAWLGACRAAEAEAVLRELLALHERVDGAASAALVEPLEELAEARWQVSDDTGSEQLLARALAILGPLEATETARLVRVLLKLAAKERKRGDLVAAAAHGERALTAAQGRAQASSSPVAVAESLVSVADSLGETYRAQGNEAGALALFQRLSLIERVLPPGAPATSPPSAPPPAPAPRCTPPSPTEARSGNVANASAVIRSLQRAFRLCYNSALQQDPNMKGAIRMTAKIGPAGEILHLRTLTPARYSEVMVACPMARLFEARFAPPDGGGATVVVPVTFVSQ